MKKRFFLFFLALISFVFHAPVFGQTINDHIFPPSGVAKPYIDFDSKGFLIEGKRTYIVSAGMEYARIPHQLWYDRLLRIKRAGFNCVEIYTFWNFHEEKENQFNFSGDHNLGQFLAIVKKMGLYAIVRVGPYYCAEWDNGGYPLWLKFKAGLRVREDNKVFEHYADRFFDRLLPIVFQNQINKGGPVILVQLENEHINGWGTVMPDGYFKHLQAKALGLGLQVPYFFSGLHHASDPASDGHLDDPSRPNPWFSTEFWSVWYSQYGPKPEDAGVYDRRTWKIIAHGGNGYNYYMVHGGSNFGYSNNNEDAASYDYGAAIGQAGDLRPIYYTFKRAAWFARSFQEVLENSTDGSAAYRQITTDTLVKISARTSAAGDLIFLDNPGSKQVTTSLTLNGSSLTLQPGEIFPIVHDFKINPAITLDWAFTRIFVIVKQRQTVTMIADCPEGAKLSLHFTAGPKDKVQTRSAAIHIKNGKIDIDTVMPASKQPLAFSFTVGSTTVRVLAMNREGTDKTWIADIAGQNYIVCGNDYLGEISAKGHCFSMETETPALGSANKSIWIYTDKKDIGLDNTSSHFIGQQKKMILSKWERKPASAPALPGYDTKGWFHSVAPFQMGADGDITADAWYRSTLKIPVSGNYTIQLKGGGRGQAFIDGKPSVKWELDDGELALHLNKGVHTFAVFTAHDGRDKLAGYLGAITNVDRKGIFDDVRIKMGGPFISNINGWYFTKANRLEDVKNGPPDFDTTIFKKYKIGDDAFQQSKGFGWFETIVDQLHAVAGKVIFSFKSVDENATVFVNNKMIAHYDGWNVPFELTVTDSAVLKGPIKLAVFIENYSNEGGIDQPVTMNTIGNAPRILDWSMKGGPGNPGSPSGWQPLLSNSNQSSQPCFYRTKFNISIPKGQTAIWRVDPKGMGHGSIWVNGHNLGRYPEKIMAPGLYIPECWLKKGLNELVIFEEDGNQPDDVVIGPETAAGRTIQHLKTILN